MKVLETTLEDVYLIEPNVFHDDRGYFFESYNASKWLELPDYNWVQDNESRSTKGVLRGLHYQTGKHGQAKLVRVIVGEIFDVAVDIRPSSNTYGQWYGTILSSENKRQLLIPRGFAHGFLVLSDDAIFSYKCDNYYSKESEGGLLYNDPSLKIKWPELSIPFQLSEKDQVQPLLGSHKAY